MFADNNISILYVRIITHIAWFVNKNNKKKEKNDAKF